MTFHDSCNPARAMGLLEEPRYVLRNVCNHFYEMPENTIREQTFCCGGGAGLGNDENMEMRLRGGLPRGNAVRHVRDAHGVNLLACMCAIDRATLPPLVRVLGAGGGRGGGARAGGQRAGDGGREEAHQQPPRRAARRRRRAEPMYDASKIVAGLVVFLILVTSPLWYNAASGRRRPHRSSSCPPTAPQCVEATEYMRASHMDLLNQWRDDVVRDGKRDYVST